MHSRRTSFALVTAVVLLLGACTFPGDKEAADPPTTPPTTGVTDKPATSTAQNTTTTAGTKFTVVEVNLLPVADSPSCKKAVKDGDLTDILSAFRAARLRGSGAEGCMTSEAKDNYCDLTCNAEDFMSSPGPICLYRCGKYATVAGFQDVEVTKSSDGELSVYWYQATLFSDDGELFSGNEATTVGPGTPIGSSTTAPLVINSASSSA